MNKIILILIALVILGAIGCAPGVAPVGSSNQNNAPAAPTQTPKAPVPDGTISLDKNFYLVLDDSGSMGDRQHSGTFANKIEAAKWAISEFVTKTVPPDVNLGLYALNTGNLVPLGKNNRDVIVEKLNRVNCGGNTPLNQAINRATVALVKQRDKQLGYGEYYIVVATDGDGTDGDVNSSVKYATDNNIPIITIGFGITNHPLSSNSLSYREATNPQELLGALEETQGESSYFDSATFTGK
jgi:Ca-activated chloride channel family protein